MFRARHNWQKGIPVLLLLTLVVGGLVSPVLHRVQHDAVRAERHGGATERCDHSDHGVAFEAETPSLSSDECRLCVVSLMFVGTPLFVVNGVKMPDRFVASNDERQVRSQPTHLPIRGPPHVA